MQIIIVKNPDTVAQRGAERISEMLKKKPDAILGLATGSTMIRLYQKLIQAYRHQRVSFKKVTTFNLDEYIGISQDNPQSYRSFMNQELFDAVDIDKVNTHLPHCGVEDNPRTIGLDYENHIKGCGGIDLQLLGIGSNGHIGFNEPGSSLSSRTRVKTLSTSTVQDNSRLFKDDEFQPHLAMTMGIRTIMDARWVCLLATGEHKANAIRDAIEGPVSAMCQASALQFHERATFILDEAAASKLQHYDYYCWAQKENQSIIDKFGSFYEIDL